MPKKNRDVAPAYMTDAWKTFVADAAGRAPAKRTSAEKDALEAAFPRTSSDQAVHDREAAHPPRREDRDLVVSHMHPTGKFHDVVDDELYQAVFVLGDGFGKGLSWKTLGGINGGADWSHVRDSSAEGWAAMANELRSRGFTEDGPASSPTP